MYTANLVRSRARSRIARKAFARPALAYGEAPAPFDDIIDEEAPFVEAQDTPPIGATPTVDWIDDDPPFDPPDADDDIFRAPTPAPAAALVEQDESLPRGVFAVPEPSILSLEPNDAIAPRKTLAPAVKVLVAGDKPAARANALRSHRRLHRADFALLGEDNTPGADLLLLESTQDEAALTAELERLRPALKPRAKIVVIGALNDVAFVRGLARRGVDQYLLAPVSDDELAYIICELFAEVETARVIAVIGARGGAGASTLAHNLAWSIAERCDARTALVDLDLAFGAAAFNLSASPPATIADALMAPDRVDDAFVERIAIAQTPRLKVFAAPAGMARAADIDAAALQHVLRYIRRASTHVILDLPLRWTPWVRQALKNADDVIILATPDLASLRNAKNLFEAIKTERGQVEPLLVLSMLGAAKGPEISTKDFTNAIGAQPVATFEFDPASFGAASLKGQMLAEAAPHSKAAGEITELASALTGLKAKKQRAPETKPAPELVLSTPAPPAPPPQRTTEPIATAPKPARRARIRAAARPNPRPGTLRLTFALLALVGAGLWAIDQHTQIGVLRFALAAPS